MTLDPNIQLERDQLAELTANVLLFDAVLRHQVFLLRFAESVAADVLRALNASEREAALVLQESLNENPRAVQRAIGRVSAVRRRAWREVRTILLSTANEVVRQEVQFLDRAVTGAVPVELDLRTVPVEKLRSIVESQPFLGRTLREWAANVAQDDLDRIQRQVKIGLAQGETVPQIARRVVGRTALRGADGTTEISRRQARGLVRTMVNAMSNEARAEMLRRNSDVFQEELYVATLDSRTTPICRSLDGDRYPVGQGPIPPVHFNCRSVRVAIIDGQVIGSRPFKTATNRRLLREYAEQEGIAVPSSRGSLPRGHKGRFDQFARRRVRELTGRVPAKVNYEQWLRRQPAQFQDEVLGRTRGRLFRQGEVSLDRFVDRSTGRQFTLEQLQSREAQAFEAAGVRI